LSQSAEAAPRTSLLAMFNFSLGSLPLAALGAAMAIYVQPYFAQGLGASLVTIALAFGIVRIVDLGVDPLLAILMDRTKTRFGRYRVWQVAGIPVLFLGTYKLFMAPPGIGLGYMIVWILVFALGNSLATLSRSAWSATVVTRYDQRSRFYGFLNAIGGVGNFFVLGIAIAYPALQRQFGHHIPNDVQLMGWASLALIPVGLGLSAVLVPERINPETKTPHVPLREYWALAKKPEVLRLFISSFALTLGPGWMGNLYIFFFTDAFRFDGAQASLLLGFYILAGVLGAPLVGLLGARFSKHRTMMGMTASRLPLGRTVTMHRPSE
jgi:GPH family glycoside/pentoside/hexuronide:cation symporter